MSSDDEHDGGAGIQRSPRTPAISLGDAVAKVKAIYEADKMAGTPVAAALKHMGYKSASGPANAAIASLRRFGLVESRSGRLFPTQRAIAILRLPDTDQRRKDALRDAVMAPKIYKGFIEQYSESGLPSRESLSHELVMDGRFNHNRISSIVSDFYDSLQFAGLINENGVLLTTPPADHSEKDEDDDDDGNDKDETKLSKKKRQMPTGTKEDVFSLDEGPVVLHWPDRISKTSAADLEDWLALIVRKAKRAAEQSPPPHDDE